MMLDDEFLDEMIYDAMAYGLCISFNHYGTTPRRIEPKDFFKAPNIEPEKEGEK